MSHQTGYSPAIGMQPRPRRAASDTDPHLAFMLAHQATNHLRLEMRSLAESVATAKDPAFARYETDIAISQCEALKERIRPFATFIDQAIRFVVSGGVVLPPGQWPVVDAAAKSPEAPQLARQHKEISE